MFSGTAAPFCHCWVAAGADSGFLVLDTHLVAQEPWWCLWFQAGPGAALGWPKPLCAVALEGQEGAGSSLGLVTSLCYLRQEHFDLKMSRGGHYSELKHKGVSNSLEASLRSHHLHLRSSQGRNQTQQVYEDEKKERELNLG